MHKTFTCKPASLFIHSDYPFLGATPDSNTKKTEVIFFGNKSRLKKLDNKTVKYLGTPLERKKEAKYLGVIFDEKMQWSSQISNITKKVNFKLGKIKSVASFLTSHTKKLLVNALVMPYFHYCSPAWSSAAPFRLRKVDKKVVDASNFLGLERQLLYLQCN